ncbi:hypothetical protein [Intrasporangium sp.]|uniref:hypothetical protein n=1 Tax=Intrasporangium sp. TaxID=1925024 RepID=UPI0032219100
MIAFSRPGCPMAGEAEAGLTEGAAVPAGIVAVVAVEGIALVSNTVLQAIPMMVVAVRTDPRCGRGGVGLLSGMMSPIE